MLPHKKSRNAHVFWARMWIIIVFILLRGADCVVYLLHYEARRKIVVAAIINSIFLTTVLLAGTWYKQNWARHFLITLLIVWMGIGITFPAYLQEFFGNKYWPIMLTCYACYIASALILICSPSIQKLTNRSFGG